MGEIETWKPVAEYEGTYEIAERVGVRRVAGGRGARAGRILKQFLDTHGYPCVTLCLHGKQTNRLIHHLVAEAFLPPRGPTDTVVRHLNDNKLDNRAENLARGTYSDNQFDSVRNGKHVSPKGAAHYGAKLTEDIVGEIRRLYATGEFTQQELGSRFGVSQVMIGFIVRRKKWAHVI